MGLNSNLLWTRREFLRGASRYGFVSALAALAVKLALRSRKLDQNGSTCINRGPCSGCRLYVDCELPLAVAVKGSSGGRLS